jgi:hypothetical protein
MTTRADTATRTFNPNEHMIRLGGRDYLEVKWRLVWFRQDHPDAIIETELVEHDRTNLYAVVKATIKIPFKAVASGYSLTEPTDRARDYIANAETSAIGRALAHLGYGTQFAEMDQAETLADSPLDRKETDPFGPRLTVEQLGRFMKAATASGNYDATQVRHAIQAITARPIHELTAPEATRLLPDFQGGLVKQAEDGRWFVEVPGLVVGGV